MQCVSMSMTLFLPPADPVVEISSGEDSPSSMDTDPLPHLQTTADCSARQHSPPQDKSLLWSLSAYCEQEESAQFYVPCLSEHIPRALQEGEGVGQPSLAEVEGVERAWQAEQACVSSVEEGGAEKSGRGLGRRDAGVQTEDGDRIRVEVRRRRLCFNVHTHIAPATTSLEFFHPLRLCQLGLL